MNQNNARLSGEGEGNRPLTLQNLRILLVEDDPNLNEMLTDFFTAFCGAEVISTTLATEALAAVQAQKPNILLSNVVLPDETGYSLIQKVRNLKPEQGGMTPAIAVTASVSDVNPQRLLEAGFQGYFSKSFQIEDLIRLVANLASSSSQ